jgi:hypothetical protein
MGPLNRWSIAAVAMVVCTALLLRPTGLVLLGVILLALATHLFVWDPERDEMFPDDWVEIGQAVATFACGFVGVGLLVASGIVALY